MVEAAQMEGAVDHRLDHVAAVLGTDDHVAKLPRSGDLRGLVEREGEDVCRAIGATVAPVQLRDPRGVDDLDRDVAFLDAAGLAAPPPPPGAARRGTSERSAVNRRRVARLRSACSP